MHQQIKNLLQDFSQLFFPHICAGCGTDALGSSNVICIRCVDALPLTHFEKQPSNPVEKIFWGRLPLQNATSLCYFTKRSLIQQLLHQLKYNGNKDVGYLLGNILGKQMLASGRYNDVDVLIPLPLFASRLKKRGYNQSAIICEGISDAMNIRVLPSALKRLTATETQTHKNRIERWQNMEGRFMVDDMPSIAGKHVLLVDDIITTGATLEACGLALLDCEKTRLSIATLAYTSHF